MLFEIFLVVKVRENDMFRQEYSVLYMFKIEAIHYNNNGQWR